MTTLDELFPDGRQRSAAPIAADDHHTARQLERLLGERRVEVDRPQDTSARPALIAMVNDAVSDARPLGTMPPASRPDDRRPRRRFDLLNASAAALAVVAIAGVVLVGGVQMATASPATDALKSLEADEKTIDSATAGLVAASQRVTEAITGADAAAEALRPALEAVRQAIDPADIPPGETQAPDDVGTIPIADAKALDTALAAIDAYRADLAAYELPSLPEDYARGDVDTESLSEVAAAIDAAQVRLSEIDRVSAQVRELRTAVDTRATAFGAQLTTFTATFPGLAQKAIDENPDAEQQLKDAVTAAGASVAASDLLIEGGAASLGAYRDAVVALVAGQVHADRVREEEEREQEERERRERERQQEQSPSPSPSPTEPAPGDPTTPPADPTDPSDAESSFPSVPPQG